MARTTVLRLLHDVSLAAWSGGALMGAVGLNSATIEVYDHTQRTRVATAGWFRWSPAAGLSMAVHVLASVGSGRLTGHTPGRSRQTALLRKARILVTVAAIGATLGTGAVGRRVVSRGDVPVATAVTPINATPKDVAKAQRLLRILQWLVPVFTGAIWLINALQQQEAT